MRGRVVKNWHIVFWLSSRTGRMEFADSIRGLAIYISFLFHGQLLWPQRILLSTGFWKLYKCFPRLPCGPTKSSPNETLVAFSRPFSYRFFSLVLNDENLIIMGHSKWGNNFHLPQFALQGVQNVRPNFTSGVCRIICSLPAHTQNTIQLAATLDWRVSQRPSVGRTSNCGRRRRSD